MPAATANLITSVEAAKYLGVSINGLYMLRARGAIGAVNISCGHQPRFRYTLAELDRFIESRTVSARVAEPSKPRRLVPPDMLS